MNRQPPVPRPAYSADQRQAVLVVAAVVFLGMSTLGLVLPVLPPLIHDTLNYSVTTVGWLMGIQAVATLLARPWSGALTDKHGGKRALQYGMVALAGAGVFYVLAITWATFAHVGLIWLAIGRILSGVGEGLLITGAAAWAIARVGLENAGRAMSLVGLAVFGGLAVGAAAGAALEPTWGFTGVAAAVVVIALGGAVPVIAMRNPTLHFDGEARLHASQVVKRIWLSGLTLALAATGFATITSFLVLTYISKGWDGGAIAVAMFAAGHVAARLVCGGLIDRVRGPSAAVVSLVLEAIGLATLWLAPTEAVALCGAALSGLGFSLVYPLLAMPALKRVDQGNRGMAIGLYDAFFDLSVGVAALGSGFVAARIGLPAVFMLASVACVLGAVTAISAYRLPASFPSPTRSETT